MNDKERVGEFYLFPLKKQVTGDLVGLQYVHSDVLWKGIKYHTEGEIWMDITKKFPVTKTAKCWPRLGDSLLGWS